LNKKSFNRYLLFMSVQDKSTRFWPFYDQVPVLVLEVREFIPHGPTVLVPELLRVRSFHLLLLFLGPAARKHGVKKRPLQQNYCEIIFICWTFHFVFFIGWAIHKFDPNKRLIHLSQGKSWNTQFKISLNMSIVDKPQNFVPMKFNDFTVLENRPY